MQNSVIGQRNFVLQSGKLISPSLFIVYIKYYLCSSQHLLMPLIKHPYMTIINLFYRTSDASCVLNKPKPSSYNLVNILPGTEFSSVDNQRKVLYGQDSFSCLQPGEFTKICIMYVLCISLHHFCSLKLQVLSTILLNA